MENDPSSSSTVRRSTRDFVLPRKFNDYVVEGKVKFGIEKVVNYAKLSFECFCFVSNLNKSIEPSSYLEASKD